MIAASHLQLDTPTLLIVVMLSAWVYGLLFLLSSRQQRGEAVLPLWGVANLSCGAGCLLFGLFAEQGPSLITYIGNGLIVAFFSLMWAGLRRFNGKPVSWPVALGVPVGIAALFAIPIHGVDIVLWHVYAYCIITGGFCVLCFVECWSGQRTEPLRMRRLAMGAFVATCFITVLRVVDMVRGTLLGIDKQWLDSGFALVFFLLFVVWSNAILLMLNERYANQLLHQAQHDALTGVLNRLGFREQAMRALERCQREQLQAWVLLYDLDHFKQVNDTHGHDTGDQFLQAFVVAAHRTLPPGTLVSRHGGEEFCILLWGCDRSHAAMVADQLREAFSAVELSIKGQLVHATVSAGVSQVPSHGDPLWLAIAHADQALYRAKQTRNIIVFDDSVA